MSYAKVVNGEVVNYPYTPSDFRNENPSSSWPKDAFDRQEIRDKYGIVNVIEEPRKDKEGYSIAEGTPILEGNVWKQNWVHAELDWEERRLFEYGTPREQIEYITENGLEAWQAHVAEIKAKYPEISPH